MRTVLAVVLLLMALAAGGYFALPYLIERETAGLRVKAEEVRQKVIKLEEFVREEEEARRATRLEPGADAAAIVKTVNGLAARVLSLEGSLKKETAALDAALKKQQDITAAALKKQSEALERERGEVRARLGEIRYRELLADVREHLLKVKTDFLAKNVGTADAEMALTVGLMEKAKSAASPEAIKSLDAAQASLRKARGEMTTDLPAAMKRVDLLWHEMGKIKGRP
jgi:hypothetical protein